MYMYTHFHMYVYKYFSICMHILITNCLLHAACTYPCAPYIFSYRAHLDVPELVVHRYKKILKKIHKAHLDVPELVVHR